MGANVSDLILGSRQLGLHRAQGREEVMSGEEPIEMSPGDTGSGTPLTGLNGFWPRRTKNGVTRLGVVVCWWGDNR